jgi:FAD/FMN-containing dehydrogenase
MKTITINTRDGTTSLPERTVETLRSSLGGVLLRPEDAKFAEATQLWNGMIRKAPALVVQPISAEDVAAAVLFATESGLLLSIKGGGHNIAGTAVAENGLMLDMSRMETVSVDPHARLAHAGPGCRLRDVDRATQEHGLATVLGFVSDTGIAGLTLGGGLGYLTRRFGWTVDNLMEVEVVTADGQIRTASRTENDDLFWAVRGGGGNFGVVTRFTYLLHEVGPTVYGGLIAWPFQRADEVLAAYKRLTDTAPRELSVWLILTYAPPAPFVPPEWQGRKVCAMAVCYSGDPSHAEQVLEPIRKLGKPILDLLHERTYTDIQSYLDGTEPSGVNHYWKTEFLAELRDDLLSTARDQFAQCPFPGAEIGVLHLGGALNEHGEDDGAVGNRDARFALGVKALWPMDAPGGDDVAQWVRHAWMQIRPFSTGRTYINFQTEDEDEIRVRQTYGTNYDRLVAVKEAYDPDNVFCHSVNLRLDLHKSMS